MLTVLMVVMTSFLAAIPFFSVLNAWMVDRTMDTPMAIVALAAVLLTLMAMISFWGSPMCWLLLLLLLGINFALPALNTVADKGHDRRMISDDVAKYQSMIERDPRNAAAHSYLGDAFMKCARYAEATESYQRAIDILPKASQTERYKLQRAQAKQQGHQDAIDICPGCRAENPPGLVRCPECNHYMKASYFLQELQREARPAAAVMVAGILVGTFIESVLHWQIGSLVCLAGMIGGAVMLGLKIKEI